MGRPGWGWGLEVPGLLLPGLGMIGKRSTIHARLN